MATKEEKKLKKSLYIKVGLGVVVGIAAWLVFKNLTAGIVIGLVGMGAGYWSWKKYGAACPLTKDKDD